MCKVIIYNQNSVASWPLEGWVKPGQAIPKSAQIVHINKICDIHGFGNKIVVPGSLWSGTASTPRIINNGVGSSLMNHMEAVHKNSFNITAFGCLKGLC